MSRRDTVVIGASAEHVVPVAEMPARLTRLVGVEVPDRPSSEVLDPLSARLIETENALAEMIPAPHYEPERPGESPGLSGLACHGGLFAIEESEFLRFRRRVGHAWPVDSLTAEHRTAVEGALWTALPALEEKASLCTDMSTRAGCGGASISARRFAEQAWETMDAAELLPGLLSTGAGVEYGQESREGDGAQGG